MITMMEVEMLAGILLRAGVNQVEAAWCNGVLDKLRAAAAAAELQQKQTTEADDD